MSAYHAIAKIQAESNKDQSSFSLEIRLRSGHIVVADLMKVDTYIIELDEEVAGSNERRITYVPYEAIDQVTPIWH